MKRIRLTESQLHKVIKEATMKVLKEDEENLNYIGGNDGPQGGLLSDKTHEVLSKAYSLLDRDIRIAENGGSEGSEQFDKLVNAFYSLKDLLDNYENREY